MSSNDSEEMRQKAAELRSQAEKINGFANPRLDAFNEMQNEADYNGGAELSKGEKFKRGFCRFMSGLAKKAEREANRLDRQANRMDRE